MVIYGEEAFLMSMGERNRTRVAMEETNASVDWKQGNNMEKAKTLSLLAFIFRRPGILGCRQHLPLIAKDPHFLGLEITGVPSG